MRILLLILSLIACRVAFAADKAVNLFTVEKPVNPQNLVQIDALLQGNCGLKGLDFYYLMDGKRKKRSKLEKSIRNLVPVVKAKPGNPAACPANSGKNCQSLSVSMPFIDKVNHGLRDPDLVVKADKNTGRCEVGAYLEAGNKVVRVKQVLARGERLSLNVFQMSAKVRVDSIKVIGTDSAGKAWEDTWECHTDCVAELKM